MGRLPVGRVSPLRSARAAIPGQGSTDYGQVSRAGGMYPRWRGDGEELFFVAPDGTMMAADFDPAIGLAKGVPRPLFPTQISVGDNRPVRRGQRRGALPASDQARTQAHRSHGLAGACPAVRQSSPNSRSDRRLLHKLLHTLLQLEGLDVGIL